MNLHAAERKRGTMADVHRAPASLLRLEGDELGVQLQHIHRVSHRLRGLLQAGGGANFVERAAEGIDPRLTQRSVTVTAVVGRHAALALWPAC